MERSTRIAQLLSTSALRQCHNILDHYRPWSKVPNRLDEGPEKSIARVVLKGFSGCRKALTRWSTHQKVDGSCAAPASLPPGTARRGFLAKIRNERGVPWNVLVVRVHCRWLIVDGRDHGVTR